jgi:hypothetical protein
VQPALGVGTVVILDIADVCRIVRARIEVAAGEVECCWSHGSYSE